jgi:hypothetical protein
MANASVAVAKSKKNGSNGHAVELKNVSSEKIIQDFGGDKITLPPLRISRIKIAVRGISPLITHAWSEKAKKHIRDKQGMRAKTAKEPKDPVADFEAAKYKARVDGKEIDVIPSLAFKNAIVSAARFSDGVKMTVLRGALFIERDVLPLEYKECVMREDMVRVGMGTADLRYRPEYRDWRVVLPIQFNSDVISAEQIANLVTRAGFGVGVFEWRPEKDGQFGRFEVEGTVQ